MNLIKEEPRDAGPKLTATSGLALALARVAHLPVPRSKRLALSDPSVEQSKTNSPP